MRDRPRGTWPSHPPPDLLLPRAAQPRLLAGPRGADHGGTSSAQHLAAAREDARLLAILLAAPADERLTMISEEKRFHRASLAALLAMRAEASLLRPGSDAAGAEVAMLAVAVAGEAGFRGGTKERRAVALAGWLFSSHLLQDGAPLAAAAKSLYLALHFAAEEGPTEELALVLSGLAHLNEGTGRFDDAVVEYRRASDTFRRVGGDPSPRAACLAEAGFLLLDMDALVLARRTLQEAFRLLDPALSPSLAVRLANGCAEAQARAGKVALAAAWRERAKRLASLPAAPDEEVRRRWSEGRIAAATGRPELARVRLDAVSAELLARGSLAEAVRCACDRLLAQARMNQTAQADDGIAPLIEAFGPPASPWAAALARLATRARTDVGSSRQAGVELLLRLRRELPAVPGRPDLLTPDRLLCNRLRRHRGEHEDPLGAAGRS
jgi:hypothetical protein